MQQLLLIIIPALITGIGTWLYNKTPKGMVEVKASVIETEIKSAGFYQNLLDDASRRLDAAILAIEHRDLKIIERDAKIDQLIEQVGILTDELRKYKQLNGKQE